MNCQTLFPGKYTEIFQNVSVKLTFKVQRLNSFVKKESLGQLQSLIKGFHSSLLNYRSQ